MATSVFDAKGLDYRWWTGADGNIWANIEGIGVQNLGKATAGYLNMAQRQGLDTNKQIADPNRQAENPTGETANRTAGSSGSTYNAEEEARKANMRSLYDRQIQDINSNVDSLGRQLENELASVKGEYNQYKNEQQSTYNANKNDYDNKTLKNKQDLESNRNKITNSASAGLRGLLRILGAMGAGNSSVAQFNIPDIVKKQADSEFGSAGEVYRQNQQSNDINWGNYVNEFENDKKKLEDWYNGQVKAKKQANEERRQSLLSDLVTAYGNRAQYGGDIGDNVKDAYNKIDESRKRVVDLGTYAKPNYTGLTSVFKSPDLASYDVGDNNLSTSVTESNTSASSPLLVALQGLNKKKNNNPYTRA